MNSCCGEWKGGWEMELGFNETSLQEENNEKEDGNENENETETFKKSTSPLQFIVKESSDGGGYVVRNPFYFILFHFFSLHCKKVELVSLTGSRV